VACPIMSRIKRNTDKPIRQVRDFSILSDVSPLIMLTSAEPRLISINSKMNRTIILYISGIFELVCNKGVH
jgi:hypothetical protein